MGSKATIGNIRRRAHAIGLGALVGTLLAAGISELKVNSILDKYEALENREVKEDK